MVSTAAGALHEAAPVAPLRPGGGRPQAVQPRPHAAEAALLGAPRRRGAITLSAQGPHVRTARRFTAALLARWDVADDDAASALLIISELAANAVQHGRSDMTVALALTDCTLHIEVADFGGLAPPRRTRCAETTDDEHGRGLGIVNVLADRTEIHRERTGWRVRATLGITCPARTYDSGSGLELLRTAQRPAQQLG